MQQACCRLSCRRLLGRPDQFGGQALKLKKLTHLIFCFGHLKGNRLILELLQIARRSKMVDSKQEPELKVLLSLGGWADVSVRMF
jgi:GH18 family chitinase